MAGSTGPDYTFGDFAEDVVYELARDYGTRGDSVWSGAVELSPDDCKRVLFDLIADIHAEELRQCLRVTA
jgi:hypothetical protein